MSTYTATVSGTYRVVEALGVCADTSAALALNNVSNPVANLSTSDTSFCPSGGAITVTASSGGTYTWYRNDTVIPGAPNNYTYTVTVPGTYSVLVENASQCSDTSNSLKMVEGTGPQATISAPDTAACAGGSVTITANAGNGYTYVWKNNGSPLGAASSSNTYSASQSGSYTCDVNSGGCASTSNAINISVLGVFASPAIAGTTTLAGCEDITETYTVVGPAGSTYAWTITGGTLNSGQGSDIVSVTFPSGTGNVSVVQTTPAGCKGTPDSISVTCTTAIQDMSSAIIKVYPNPGHDVIFVEISGTFNRATATITDLAGRMVQMSEVTGTIESLNVSNLAEAAYLLSIRNDGFARTFNIQKQ
jgi:hypothetical protein